MSERQVDAIIGLQMGDEGKGRFAHQLAGNYDIVARFNGGANAGHTFSHNEKEINTHQIPSGIVHDGVVNLVTLSSLVDPVALRDEANVLWEEGIVVTSRNLKISDSANLVLPHHIMLDEIRELGSGGQGSTKRGISFAAADKYRRAGVTLVDFSENPTAVKELLINGLDEANREFDRLANKILDDSDIEDAECSWLLSEIYRKIRVPSNEWQNWKEATEDIRTYEVDTVQYVHEALKLKKRILAEGAQSSGLDIEHGMRPETTSSHVTVGGVLNSLGIGPRNIGEVFGVAKLTKSRVGGSKDSFPTVIEDQDMASRIRGRAGEIDSEYGKSTGRERMVGWLDLPELKRAILVNGVTQLLFTKLDCVPRAGAHTQIATHYVDEHGDLVDIAPNSVAKVRKMQVAYARALTWQEDISRMRNFDELPLQAQRYIGMIESALGTPVTMIGVGPKSEQVIKR